MRLVAGTALVAAITAAVLGAAPQFEVARRALQIEHDRKYAEWLVEMYCIALGGCHEPVLVKVVAWDEMPRGMMATTERIGWTNDVPGCLLKFTAEALVQPQIVAHEVCHCVNDYSVLSPGGYFMLTTRERQVREQWAHQCASAVIRGEKVAATRTRRQVWP